MGHIIIDSTRVQYGHTYCTRVHCVPGYIACYTRIDNIAILWHIDIAIYTFTRYVLLYSRTCTYCNIAIHVYYTCIAIYIEIYCNIEYLQCL